MWSFSLGDRATFQGRGRRHGETETQKEKDRREGEKARRSASQTHPTLRRSIILGGFVSKTASDASNWTQMVEATGPRAPSVIHHRAHRAHTRSQVASGEIQITTASHVFAQPGPDDDYAPQRRPAPRRRHASLRDRRDRERLPVLLVSINANDIRGGMHNDSGQAWKRARNKAQANHREGKEKPPGRPPAWEHGWKWSHRPTQLMGIWGGGATCGDRKPPYGPPLESHHPSVSKMGQFSSPSDQ
jgi:hypothetical protein